MQANIAPKQDIQYKLRQLPFSKGFRIVSLLLLFVAFTTAAIAKSLSFSDLQSTLIVSPE